MRMPVFILLLAGCFLALPGSAQDEADADAPAAGTPADEEAGADAAEGADGAGGDEEEDEDDFEFSEEVPADEQLVFPVDI